MSNSFVEGLRDRSCAGPLGDGFQPNVFLGTSYSEDVVIEKSGRFPSVTLGTDALSLEFWAAAFHYSPWPGSDTHAGSVGFWRDRAADAVFSGDEVLEFNILPPFAEVNVDDQSGGSRFVGNITVPRGWHYWAINFDPSGDLEVFLDGASQGTDSAAIGSLGTRPFGPLVAVEGTSGIGPANALFDLSAGTDPGGDFPESLTGPFEEYEFPHILFGLGPIALHVGGANPLLSAADMALAMQCRFVNEFDDGTEIIYRWFDIEFTESEPKWEFNRRHGMRGLTDFPPMPVGIPVGPDESVRVPNFALGGSASEALVLQTVEKYGQENDSTATLPADGMRGWAVFGADPFFSQGGGVPPGT